MTDKNTDTTKVQSGVQYVLLGLLTGMRVRGYLQRQKQLKSSAITKAHLKTGDCSQTWSTLHSLQAAHQPGE